MKGIQHILRVLVLAGSLGGFFGGWALLAHAGKPVDAQPAPEVAPASLPPLNFDQPSLAPLPSLPSSSGSIMPRLRTRGS